MAHLLPHPTPLLLPRVFHKHLGVDRKTTAIPASKSGTLLFDQLIIYVKAITGRTEQCADTATYTLSRYLLPVVLILKTGQ